MLKLFEMLTENESVVEGDRTNKFALSIMSSIFYFCGNIVNPRIPTSVVAVPYVEKDEKSAMLQLKTNFCTVCLIPMMHFHSSYLSPTKGTPAHVPQ